jgi:beta-glucosidase
MKRQDFGDDFFWGVSTAAYQIEGAASKDGKGSSIWDEFTRKKNKIFNNQNADITCDFYHKYTQDIYLVYELNIPNFRFSISWTRIFPNGIGYINPKGIDFYNRVIDFCLELGIEPWITLYHWDLPLELQKNGGWTNRDIINWFSAFVECCVKHFGDRVTKWIVLNEPMVFTGAGYFLGLHAPGLKGINNFIPTIHHAALCQAIGARIIKSFNPNSFVGTTFSHSHLEPFDANDSKDHIATQKVDALLNRLYIEPLLGLGYPLKDLPLLNRIEKYIQADDMNLIAFDMDFVGLQVYTRELVKYSPIVPFLQAKIVKASDRCVHHTIMDWEVNPNCIYNALMSFEKYKNIKEIIITENGAAFDDLIVNNKINDQLRKDYIIEHLKKVLKAKNEGSKVKGYFVWTLLDNFEWAEGFKPKFGLVHFDENSQKRIVKESGVWYSDFLSQ